MKGNEQKSNEELFMSAKLKKPHDNVLSEKGITIGEKLDSGGFGTVYKASHHGQTVAVKVIKIDFRKKGLDEDLGRELAILLRVKHPNIVKCYEAFKTKRKVYIFMEFASGGTVGLFFLSIESNWIWFNLI